MRINPYLNHNGNSEAAFKFYQQVLDAKVELILAYEGTPVSMPVLSEWKNKIMHGRISIDGEVLMASDAPPGPFHQPQGFSVSRTVGDPVDAGRRLKALSECGRVNLAFGKTFFSKGFGMCVGPFRIPWMVNCPLED